MRESTVSDIIKIYDFVAEEELYVLLKNAFSSDDKLKAERYSDIFKFNRVDKKDLRKIVVEDDEGNYTLSEFYRDYDKLVNDKISKKIYIDPKDKEKGTKAEYKAYSNKIWTRALYKLVNHVQYFDFSEIRNLDKNMVIKNYISKELNLDKELIVLKTEEKLREYLEQLNDKQLNKLHTMIESNQFIEDCNDHEDYDYTFNDMSARNMALYNDFLDVLYRYDNPDEYEYSEDIYADDMALHIEILWVLSKAMSLKTDAKLNNEYEYFKKRRISSSISDEALDISELAYSLLPENYNSAELVQELMKKRLRLDGELLEKTDRIFSKMSEIKWNIIRTILRTYKNPMGEAVTKRFKDNIETDI